MADVAEHHGLEIMHAHYAIPHASAALLARMALEGKLKVVTTLHGTDITVVGSDPSYLSMVRLAIRESDAVTSVSEYLRDETYRTFKVDRPIDVIPNFVTAPAGPNPRVPQVAGPQDTADPHPHLQLPPRQAGPGRHEDLRDGATRSTPPGW